MAADDDMSLYLNGELLFEDEDGLSGPRIRDMDVSAYLVPGDNLIAIKDNLIAIKAHDSFGGFEGVLVDLTYTHGPLIGDIDLDGEVSFDDFLILSVWFSKRVTPVGSNGDLDSSGTVDFLDFLTLSENFGATTQNPQPATVPEPSATLLTGFAVLALFVGRKRRR